MKTKHFIFSVFLFCVFTILYAQEKATTEATFTVYGNCAQCKTRIEKALRIQGVESAQWNRTTKILRVRYNPSSLTIDSLQQRVAAVGHDTEHYKAPDSVYNALPACCKYRKN